MNTFQQIIMSATLLTGIVNAYVYSGEPLMHDSSPVTHVMADTQRGSGSYGRPTTESPSKGEERPMHQSFDNDVFIEADFIYWNVNQEGNNYAAGGYNIFGVGEISSPQGSVYRPKSKMAPGFKVALGVNLKNDLWDTVLRYTWLHAHSTGSTPEFPLISTDPSPSSVKTTSLDPLFSFSTSSLVSCFLATADSTVRFNALDAELGKNFYLSPSFSLRTFVGLKGSWIKEELALDYFGGLFTNAVTLANGTPITNYDATNSFQFSQYYWGLGPRVGTSAVWNLYKNHLGLFAETAFSALWSRVKLKAAVYESLTYTPEYTAILAAGNLAVNNYTNYTVSDQQYLMHTLIPAFELTLGLQSEWIFENGSRFLMSAGWETQMFLFMVQHSSTIADLNLNMEGLTLKFRYDF